MTDYLAKYGTRLVENGYNIVPILRGSKAPGLDRPARGWSRVVATVERVQRWIDQGYGSNGIGIIAANTPGVDVDCQDHEVTGLMRTFIADLLGETIERVGLAPKTLLLYRTDQTFSKVTSHDYLDKAGRKARLEVLADGQQFVALAVHPDTRQPYRWLDKHGPHDTAAADLPTISQADALAIRDEFQRLATTRGWQETHTLKRLNNGAAGINVFAEDSHKVEDLSTDELRSRLMLVQGASDYETWLQIGMALWHQFDGDERGLTLWDEWSSSASNYDAEALAAKWPSFEIEGKSRQPVTARLIIKLAGEAEQLLVSEHFATVKTDILAAEDLVALQAACGPAKTLAFDRLARAQLAGLVQKRHKEITNTALPVSDARALVRYEDPDRAAAPPWLDGYVYVQTEKLFYNTKTRLALDTQAFNQSYGRFVLSRGDILEGKSQPDHPAADLALNRYQITTVAKRMYMPGEGDIFMVSGVRYANSYDDGTPPVMPDAPTVSGKAAVRIAKQHLEHLIADARDRRLFTDWLAWPVQTLQRVPWMPVLQGTEGDGKSWFHHLLAAVHGRENVNLISGEALKEKYTSWAENGLVVFIEEIRLHGADRYVALNNMKPYITNIEAPIRRMQTDLYSVINRSSYIAVTNYRDAIPAGMSDTRTFPIYSRWQTKDAIDKFKADNPEYYNDLYAAVHEAGALRQWLMEHTISPEFNANGRAPESSNRSEMIALSRSEGEDMLDDALEDGRVGLSAELLDSTRLREAMMEDGGAPTGHALKVMLQEAGFSFLGRVKIGDQRHGFWSINPSRFLPEPDQKIRDYLANGGL